MPHTLSLSCSQVNCHTLVRNARHPAHATHTHSVAVHFTHSCSITRHLATKFAHLHDIDLDAAAGEGDEKESGAAAEEAPSREDCGTPLGFDPLDLDTAQGPEDDFLMSMGDDVAAHSSSNGSTTTPSQSGASGSSPPPLPNAPRVTIRVVANYEKRHKPGEKLMSRYGPVYPRYPAEFPLRSKCIIITQQHQGLDLMIFVMFVYE